MNSPIPACTPADLLTVGDLDPLDGVLHDVDYTGQRVAGRYRVRARIGRGGMADVYRARDELLDLDVALKILHPRLASPDMRARLLQEARAAAAIQHPHMLRVVDVGELRGTLYLVMELLRGATLRAFLHERGGRLPWREAVAVLTPAMDALHAAHELDLVHRDIKPENLFITTRGRDTRFVIVLDLGIAKVGKSLRTPLSPATTRPDRAIGTPTHMAPEQVRGELVDRRADVYAMGVTLYQTLTGRLPFPPGEGCAAQYTMLRHLAEDPPPPRQVAPDADIPAALEALVLATLAKDRDGRPPSMQALVDALRELAAEHAPASPRPRARRPARASLLLVAALCVGLQARSHETPVPEDMSSPGGGRAAGVDPVVEVGAETPTLATGPDGRDGAGRGDDGGDAGRVDDGGAVVAAGREVRPGDEAAGRARARRRRVMASEAVAACRREFGRRAWEVAMMVASDGRVEQARVVAGDVTPETACIEAALVGQRLAPGPRREHLTLTLPGAKR